MKKISSDDWIIVTIFLLAVLLALIGMEYNAHKKELHARDQEIADANREVRVLHQQNQVYEEALRALLASSLGCSPSKRIELQSTDCQGKFQERIKTEADKTYLPGQKRVNEDTRFPCGYPDTLETVRSCRQKMQLLEEATRSYKP